MVDFVDFYQYFIDFYQHLHNLIFVDLIQYFVDLTRYFVDWSTYFEDLFLALFVDLCLICVLHLFRGYSFQTIRNYAPRAQSFWRSGPFSRQKYPHTGHATYIRWYLRSRCARKKQSICYLACLRHLIRWRAVTNLIFFCVKVKILSFIRAQHVLKYHVI